MHRRIRVQGCSGSGKTTLARELAARLGLPHLELDALYHREDWRAAEPEEFAALLDAFLAETPDGWVACGNYTRHTARLAAEADTVVWLDYPRWLVMARMLRRTVARAALRRELWNGNRERWRSLLRLDPADNILLWAWTQHGRYVENYLPQWECGPGQGSEPRWVRLSTLRETRAWMDSLTGQSPT